MSIKALLSACLRTVVLSMAIAHWPSFAVFPTQAADPVPGTQFSIPAEELPQPYASPSASNSPRLVRRPSNQKPVVPDGFEVTLFAENLGHPRNLIVAANGDVLLAESRPGRITLLRDSDGDGRADLIDTFVAGFRLPHGLALATGALYIADARAIWRLPYHPGDESARGRATRITAKGAFGDPGGHWTRNLAIHPLDGRLFVSIGSEGNLAEEPLPRASIQVFDPDGSGQRTYASGLRNPVGIAFHPSSGALYTVVNERDGLGDELVPDYLTAVEEGAFYGWPYAYSGNHPQPGFADLRPDLVAAARLPDLLFRSHSAPIGLTFYDGASFPQDYHGDAFVALRGSWNADLPRGYFVARVPFRNGRPLGGYEVFMSGFRLDDKPAGRAEVWGRPTGVAVTPGGGLLVSDDSGGTLWLVRWRGE